MSKKLPAAARRPRRARPSRRIAVSRCTRRAIVVKPFGAVIDGVHARDHREQHLRRADVRRRLFAADVLLARLQREPVRGHRRRRRRVTPTRRPGSERLNASRVAMNAACGPPKPIGTPKRCDEPTTTSAPHSPGGASKRQCEQIGGDDDQRAVRMRGLDERAVVAHVAVGPRILQQDAERAGTRRQSVAGPATTSMPSGARARAHDVERLREDVVGDEEAPAGRRADAQAKRHRLGGGRRFVEHRRVRDRHAGQVADHRLEIDQRLEPALRDLGLVRACTPCTRRGSRARCAG